VIHITGGNLQDEDFPPIFGGYSSTNSEQRDGRLAYATVDLGWATNIFEGVKVGFFAGYSYNYERVNAFGCVQAASNPFICAGSFSDVQVEALLRYQFVNGLSLGVGGRYWRISAKKFTSVRLETCPGEPGKMYRRLAYNAEKIRLCSAAAKKIAAADVNLPLRVELGSKNRLPDIRRCRQLSRCC
jgi:hypothetical protein